MNVLAKLDGPGSAHNTLHDKALIEWLIHWEHHISFLSLEISVHSLILDFEEIHLGDHHLKTQNMRF